mgnify:FL=1
MIVIDASIAIKLIFAEEASNIVEKLFTLHVKKKEEIIVPSFLFIEAANVLATKTRFTKKEISKGLRFLYSFHLTLHEVSENEIIEASILAKQCETSVYDMLYAVIAKTKKIKLITADDKFVKKVGRPFVQSLTQFSTE